MRNSIGRILRIGFSLIFMMGFFQFSAEAQLLKKLKKRSERAAEEAVLRKTEQKVYKETGKAMDSVFSKPKDKKEDQKKNGDTSSESSSDRPLVSTKDPKTQGSGNEQLKPWSKYNFVPGDIIIFDDDLQHEENGEFPSRWDLIDGNAENASLGEEKVINFKNKSLITPLMDDQEYLPEVFTIEFDAYFDKISQGPQFWQSYGLRFSMKSGKWYYPTTYPERGHEDYFSPIRIYRHGATLESHVNGNTREYETYEKSLEINESKWVHVALAFNKRSLKVFVEQYRVLNIPNLGFKPKVFSVDANTYYADGVTRAIKNIRVAEGGKKLYDRVIADGKFVTRGILFDVNQATIKPESMGVINEVSRMMKEHEDLNFSIEGHTDSDGAEDYNIELSSRRAVAVKSALVDLGIGRDRFQTKGWGESVPVTENTTPEGKANNRRVEFVKI